MIAVLGLVYVLVSPTDFLMVTFPSAVSAHSTAPLTLLDNPQYAHEYDTRAYYITDQLEGLRNATQAGRAYLALYKHDSSPSHTTRTVRISTTFEVGQEGFTYHIRDFQNFARVDWLQIKRGERTLVWFGRMSLPRSYGLELFNNQNAAIGYLGIEYLNSPLSFERHDHDMDVLEQTASSIQMGLLQPLEHLNISEEQ
jgi:hypothetical protein